MKRFGSVTAAALFGVGLISSGPALAFDGQATPPIFLAVPEMPLTSCLVMEKQGYPNPDGSGCAYLNAGSFAAWNPPVLWSGRSVAIGQLGMQCSTPVTVCRLRHELFVGNGCSCTTASGRAPGIVTP